APGPPRAGAAPRPPPAAGARAAPGRVRPPPPTRRGGGPPHDLHRKAQWPLVSAPVTRRADLLADASEHTALLDALIARDLAVVQSLVREHFTGAPG
ncbi:hypothetical protein ACFXBC_01075, partial [Streptomyces sp. NPDC059398]